MPQIPRHLKLKRSQKNLLAKKKHFLKNFPVVRSCKQLCKQLKRNNSALAKALSKEKQESQLLFSENVDLTAMVQDLGVACNKRDAVISNILNNAKEMLQMIVTMSGYLTNTISYCQEFAKLNGTDTRPYNSAGRRESVKRLSMKSPTRGVVKPMVSGHTITKPTINLSRLNMQHINNSSNLSIIPEVTTSPRNEESNNSVSMRLRRYSNGRKCRMPERVIINRDSGENELRMSEGSRRHTKKLSARHSKSRSSINDSSRHSHLENIGSPRVQLNDVSKLLQNSQTINIRTLENQNSVDANIEVAPKVDDSDVSQNNDSMSYSLVDNDSLDKHNRGTDQDETRNNTLDMEHGKKSVHTKENVPSNWEDPLEGPSWLFNNSQTVPFTSKEKKTDNLNNSNDNDTSMILNGMESNIESSDDEEIIKPAMPLPGLTNEDGNLDSSTNETNENTSLESDNNNLLNSIEVPENNESENTTELNRLNFVTVRRGCLESEDEDDFTLILPNPKSRNMHFDIDDLKLPVIDLSILPSQASAESEMESTEKVPLQKISQIFPIPSVSRNSLNDSEFNQSTVKLPTLMNNDDYEDDGDDGDDDDDDKLTASTEEPHGKRKKQTNRESNYSNGIDRARSSNQDKQNKKKKTIKDPSSVKVVLEKLNESDVKLGTSSSFNKSSLGDSYHSLNADLSGDSDSNASSSSQHALSRPRRRRAPVTLHEPNLKKKLRRNT